MFRLKIQAKIKKLFFLFGILLTYSYLLIRTFAAHIVCMCMRVHVKRTLPSPPLKGGRKVNSYH